MTDSDFALAHRLNSILGWLELGNIREARLELLDMPAELKDRMEVLEIRWVLDSQSQDWEAALDSAERLLEVAPEKATGWLHRAYALRRVPEGGLNKAAEALLPALTKFPKEPTVPYNLACYACQLGNVDEARQWLAEAVKRGGAKKIKAMALEDSDLEPLWGEIGQI